MHVSTAPTETRSRKAPAAVADTVLAARTPLWKTRMRTFSPDLNPVPLIAIDVSAGVTRTAGFAAAAAGVDATSASAIASGASSLMPISVPENRADGGWPESRTP